jgi:hypothetical protein
MQLLAAMAPPGGGRNAFSARIMSCFSLLCMTSPSDSQLRRIFSALLSSHLADFGDAIKPLGESITQVCNLNTGGCSDLLNKMDLKAAMRSKQRNATSCVRLEHQKACVMCRQQWTCTERWFPSYCLRQPSHTTSSTLVTLLGSFKAPQEHPSPSLIRKNRCSLCG